MSKTIKATLFSAISLGLGTNLTFPTFAANTKSVDPCGAGVPKEVRAASGCGNAGDDQIVTVVQNILYAIIGVCGIVAVVYIVLGGISYMTSGGDPGKVKKARDTIVYAVIGLVVCALAFVVVNFTINNVLKEG
ncbi:hypothetical protein IKG10_00235 [Candidatus Saccharibacteria bacterium]|nr:hypothetical protein [Candidatus Saccharibacteria bacterium]